MSASSEQRKQAALKSLGESQCFSAEEREAIASAISAATSVFAQQYAEAFGNYFRATRQIVDAARQLADTENPE